MIQYFIKAKGDSAIILPIGTRVRVQLEAPIDVITGNKLHGNFNIGKVFLHFIL